VSLGGLVNMLDLAAVVLGAFYARIAQWLAEPLRTGLTARVVSGGPVDVVVFNSAPMRRWLGTAGRVTRQVLQTGTRQGQWSQQPDLAARVLGAAPHPDSERIRFGA
jgi:hypothetical protein